MSFLRKQTYQHLFTVFFPSKRIYGPAEYKGQTQGQANINQLPFGFLIPYFFRIQEWDRYFLGANVYKSGIVQKVIKAIY